MVLKDADTCREVEGLHRPATDARSLMFKKHVQLSDTRQTFKYADS